MELKSARKKLADTGQLELLDFFEHIKATPDGHIVKGMYVAGIWDALAARGVTTRGPRIQKFKSYPLKEYMELLLDASITLFPSQGCRDGLQSLGRLAIPTFASSIVGGVIMGTVGGNWSMALKCVSKGYEVSLNPGRAIVREMGDDFAIVSLREVWNFGDTYQVGVLEGLMSWCNRKGNVVPEVLSECDCDLRVQWVHAEQRSHHTGNLASVPPPAL